MLRRGLAGHTWISWGLAAPAFSKAGRLLTKCLLRDAYYPSRNLFILNTDFLAISRAGRV